MKPIVLIFTSFLIFFTATCNSNTSKENTPGTSPQTDDISSMKITGKIEPIGMTSWQYGTHTITTEDNFYALRSDKVDLNSLEGKSVTIIASKVEGYPVDGGPEFLEVDSVNE